MDSAVPPTRPAPSPPRLRLVGAQPRGGDAGAGAPPERVTEATDPRWVLAVRTAALLDGPVLVPENRRRLLAVGASVGLSPFDTALVIAMVQDQARRGTAPRACAAAAEPRLRHVPRPPARRVPWRLVLLASAGALLLEAALLAWWLGVAPASPG